MHKALIKIYHIDLMIVCAYIDLKRGFAMADYLAISLKCLVHIENVG